MPDNKINETKLQVVFGQIAFLFLPDVFKDF